MPKAAYIHIPFCRRRCFYCDFAISVVGNHKRGDTSAMVAAYIETLIAEIEATPILADQPLETVFFGGGTPSLLASKQVATILSAIDRRFGIAATAEISMEMDPATFELSHAIGYQKTGINRVSLGAQAFQDELLAASGRFHRQIDIVRSLNLLRQAGFENISLDLMSGLPHQTMAHWEDSLQQAIALSPTHISTYDLIVEPQTAFARYFTPGEAPLPSDQLTAQMYNVAQAILTAQGYEHYEICNFTQPGYESRHNLTYWRCEYNYGFGMGATSYLPQPSGPQRIDRPRTQKTYRNWVERFIKTKGTTPDPVLPPAEQVLETFMMGLRLQPGISLDGVIQVFGQAGLDALNRAIAPHIQNQWVIVESPHPNTSSSRHLQSKDRIRLSDPKGFLMSNVVITDAFNALESVSVETVDKQLK
ncbi:MAG: radical SAM family heme chaperone HemW [Cyanobacteria bacterium J06650_10]